MSWLELAVIVVVALPLAILLQDWRATVGWLVFHVICLCCHAGTLLFHVFAHLVSIGLSVAAVASSFHEGLIRGFRSQWRRSTRN